MSREACSWNHENPDCRFLHDRWCLLEDMSIGDSPTCWLNLIDSVIGGRIHVATTSAGFILMIDVPTPKEATNE